MQYKSPMSYGLKVMAKVKIFFHNADSDGRVITLY